MKIAIEGPRFLGNVAALCATILLSTAALADQVKVVLRGDAEVPPVQTQASGSGTITINSDMSVSGSVTTTGLKATMAHIHMAPKGKNGPVTIPLTKKGEDSWSVPEGTKLTDAQYKAYKAGELYVNVHTDENKAGEIRGQLMP